MRQQGPNGERRPAAEPLASMPAPVPEPNSERG